MLPTQSPGLCLASHAHLSTMPPSATLPILPLGISTSVSTLQQLTSWTALPYPTQINLVMVGGTCSFCLPSPDRNGSSCVLEPGHEAKRPSHLDQRAEYQVIYYLSDELLELPQVTHTNLARGTVHSAADYSRFLNRIIFYLTA